MLNPIADAAPTRAAIAQAIHFLKGSWCRQGQHNFLRPGIITRRDSNVSSPSSRNALITGTAGGIDKAVPMRLAKDESRPFRRRLVSRISWVLLWCLAAVPIRNETPVPQNERKPTQPL
jgi:hypothetical protein